MTPRTLPLPSFFDPNLADKLYLPRIDEMIAAAKRFALDHDIKPAIDDKFKIGMLDIDNQIDFGMSCGGLFVPGAVEDTIRGEEFVARNLAVITRRYFTLDSHKLFQIFFKLWWEHFQSSDNPADFSLLAAADTDYQAMFFPRESIAYKKALEDTGKFLLQIWPFHTLMGTPGHAIVPLIFEMATFHSVARNIEFKLETKGQHPLTENYSVMSPEVKNVLGKAVGQFNTRFFKALMENDRLYVKGQAKSHCLKFTIEDLINQVKAVDAGLLDKLYVIEDCTSPVPAVKAPDGTMIVDFPKIADEAFDRFKNEGVHVVQSTDPIIF